MRWVRELRELCDESGGRVRRDVARDSLSEREREYVKETHTQRRDRERLCAGGEIKRE